MDCLFADKGQPRCISASAICCELSDTVSSSLKFSGGICLLGAFEDSARWFYTLRSVSTV